MEISAYATIPGKVRRLFNPGGAMDRSDTAFADAPMSRRILENV